MGYEIDLLQRILGRIDRSIDKQCIGDEKLAVSSATVVVLNVPTNATSAIITVEADATTTDPTRVVRFRESGTAPTASTGTPLGDLDTYECIGPDALSKFKIIGIESPKAHTLNINYYR